MSKVMALCLEECQKSFASHPENIAKLRIEFNSPKLLIKTFKKYLKKLFVMEKNSLPLKRVLKFIARVGTFPATDKNTKIWADAYCSGLILFSLRYVNSNFHTARMRSLELIGALLNDLPDDFCLNESVFNTVKKKVYPLLRDPKHSIRVQAVLSLSRLQQPLEKNDKVTKKFKKMLTHDPKRQVREACLRNIGFVIHTLPDILSRSRDSSEIVRKAVYEVAKKKLDIKSLSIHQRNSFLHTGLQDRDEAVRLECRDLLLNNWYPSCGNIIEFLKLLDVEENENDVNVVLETILSGDIKFEKEFTPPFKSNLTPEKVFLWKTMVEYIEKEKPLNINKIDELLIEAKYFIELLEENKKEKFIFKQLLILCKYVDVKDEFSRDLIIKKTRCFIGDLEVSNKFIAPISDVARKIFKSEVLHAKYLMETILGLLEIAEENSKKEKLDSDKRKEMDMLIYTRILEVIKDMLRFSQLGVKLPNLKFLKEKIILSCITRKNPFIRALAIEALALYCYFDLDEAKKYIVVLYHVLKNDQEALQLIAMKSIIDLMLIHKGLSSVEVELIKNENFAGENEESPKESFLDFLSTFLASEDEMMTYTTVEGFAKLMSLGRVRSVKFISMFLLLLFNPSSSEEEPVQQCLSLFFNTFLYLQNNSFAKNSKLFAKAFIPTLKVILRAPENSPLSRIDVGSFADWCFSFLPNDELFVVEEMRGTFREKRVFLEESRKEILESILKELKEKSYSDDEGNKEGIILAKIISKKRICSNFIGPLENIIELAQETEKIIKFKADKLIKIHLHIFMRFLKETNK